MSGLNLPQMAFRIASLALVSGASLVAPTLAFAAAKATTTKATTTTDLFDNPYRVHVPASFDYNTTGLIRSAAAPATVQGPNQLSFDNVTHGNYVTDSNQSIQLGQFVINPTTTASGTPAVTTYDNTPFVIQIHAPGFDKTSKVPLLSSALPNFGRAFHLQSQTLNSLLIRGHLDGTVNASAPSSVTATVDSVRLGSIQGGNKQYATSYTFPVRSTDLKLPTSWTMNTAGVAANPAATGGAIVPTTTAASTTTAANIGGAATTTASPTTTTAAQILANPAAETLTASSTSTATSTNLAAGTTTTATATSTATTTSTNLATPTPTPEPTTAVIFAAAIGGFAWSRRRSK